MRISQVLKITLLPMLTAAFLVQAVSAQSQKPAQPCSKPENRQFDFWVGDWDVTVNNQPAGTNSIQLILNGCVLLENWSGAKGGTGKSFNLYDASRGKWQQTWVDNSGSLLELHGEFKDGAMRLAGETAGKDGKKTLHRITWYPLDKDRVRQHWEQSQDDGKTWTSGFDGLYTRKK